MGIDSILERITAAGNEAAEKTVAKAHEKAAEILKQKAADSSAENDALIKEAEQEAINQINHVRSTVALESRKLVLAAKREVIDEVFDDVIMAFGKMPSEDYAVFMAKLARKVSERGTLTFSANDAKIADRVRDLLKDNTNYKVTKQTVKTIQSGFVLKYDNVQINCSVESIVENMKNELEPMIVAKLFV